MKRERSLNKLLVEPASVATGDIAFNLIIFFLVCASTQPDSGKKQDLPRSEQTKQQEQKDKNIEVALTRSVGVVSINGDQTRTTEFPARIARLLKNKPRPEDKVVVIKSTPDTPYSHWIAVTAEVQNAGGNITIQREETQNVTVGN